MKKSVLILDDEIPPRRDLGKYLLREGFVVHTAAGVDEFSKIVDSEHIDYAVVDLRLDYRGESGGIPAIAYMKRNQPWSKVIVLSGYVDEDQYPVLKKEGADGFIAKGGPENYIRAVIAKIQEFVDKEPKKRCFVIMPMSASASCRAEQWTEIFEKMIEPAVNACGYECARSQGLAGNIIKLVLDDLNRADLVLADLTDRNPNVFYELGVRHALRDNTILISQSFDHIPFDLRPYSVIIYDWTMDSSRQKFVKNLRDALSHMAIRPASAVSPVREYLGVTAPAKSDSPHPS